jgi:alpha-ketoglutarate-dependent taurine dioxygenase
MPENMITSVRTSPLTGSIGVRVDDLNGLNSGNSESAAIITDLVREYGVVFLPAQDGDIGDFVALGHRLGDVQPAHPIKPGLDGYPEVLGNDTGHPSPSDAQPQDIHNRHGGNWHIDGTFVPDVPVYSMLFARTAPAAGGDTVFADLAGAYEALSAPLRALVDGLSCEHSAQRQYGALASSGDPGTQQRLAEITATVQPLVHADPLTGRRSLVLNPNCVRSIRGLSQLESDTILSLLMSYATIPERTVRWKWNAGDVVIWDNRRLLHTYLFDHTGQDRLVLRLIVGTAPLTAPGPA